MKVLKFIFSILKDFGMTLLALLLVLVVVGMVVGISYLASILIFLICVTIYIFLSSFMGAIESIILMIILFICIVEIGSCIIEKQNPFKSLKEIIKTIVEYFQNKWNQIN